MKTTKTATQQVGRILRGGLGHLRAVIDGQPRNVWMDAGQAQPPRIRFIILHPEAQ